MRHERLCKRCLKRPAKFFQRHWGRVKSDDDHELCFQCFRAVQNQQRHHGADRESATD